MASKFVPNDELSSARIAPVTNRRLFQPNCCWAYTPTLLFSLNELDPLRASAELIVVTSLVGSPVPVAPRNVSFKTKCPWPPWRGRGALQPSNGTPPV